jgi:hypothetical protein
LDHRSRALRPASPAAEIDSALPRSRPKRVAWLGLLTLAVAELAWLLWFLIVPLPNANNTGLPTNTLVRRGWLLLKAFPEVVPDTSFGESLLGQALKELTHVQHLPERLPIVLAAALIAAAAVGLGDAVVRGLQLEKASWIGERFAIDFGVGAALLAVLTLVAGRMGWIAPWPIRIALGVLAAGGLLGSFMGKSKQSEYDWSGEPTGKATPSSKQKGAALPPKADWSRWVPLLFVVPFVVVMMLGAMLPAVDFDVLEYHLEGPKEYYQAGRIAFLPHNVYTNMPFGVEMLHLLGMEVLGDWWWGGLAGQLTVALFAPATAVVIAATVRRVASVRAAWIAAIVYLSTPWIYRLAVIAYVEGPLCFYHAALVWCALRTGDPSVPRRRVWCLMGCLAGAAMGCKYTALVSAVLPFGALALAHTWQNRWAAPVVCYLAGWAVVMGPWLGKNVIDTGNPVYPLANRLIHGRYWDQAREAQWSAVHGPRAITAHELADSLVDVAGRSDWQSPLYVALVPLAFARPGSRRLAAVLLGYVTYLFLTWWLLTHRLDRFWLPILPALAVLAGLGGDWKKSRGWSILLGAILTLGLLTNLTYISTALAGLNEWTGDLASLRRDIARRLNAPLARLDAELPADSRTLLVGQAAVFHLNHSVSYNTVFNDETIETLAKGKSPEQFRQALRRLGLTHVYIDWKEIKRHRQPGGYGFTDFVTRERVAGWVANGVLSAPLLLGADQELYRVSNQIESPR